MIERIPSVTLTPGAGTSRGAVASSRLGFRLDGLRRARLPAGHPPVLLVVLDTEEEFDWSRAFDRGSRSVTAIQGLVQLQRMFVEVGIRPTYVIDHPVAATGSSAEVLASFVQRGEAEVGAHLHPWVTPPDVEEVSAFNSYGGNLEPALERRKLEALTAAIEANLGLRPRTFKAGRYGLGSQSVESLRHLGFATDLSTTPGFNWSGDGGPDFRGYPSWPYWIPGAPPLLEIPTSGGYFGPLRRLGARMIPVNNRAGSGNPPLVSLLRRLRLARRVMLSPEGTQLWELQALADTLLGDGDQVVTLSLHSPTIHPGHTPFVRNESDRAAFFLRIRRFAEWLRRTHGAVGLTADELRTRLAAPEARATAA